MQGNFSSFVVKLDNQHIAVRKLKPSTFAFLTDPTSRILFDVGGFRFMDSTDKLHTKHYLILRFGFAPTDSRLICMYEVKMNVFYELCALHMTYMHTGSGVDVSTLLRRLDYIVSQCEEVPGM